MFLWRQWFRLRRREVRSGATWCTMRARGGFIRISGAGHARSIVLDGLVGGRRAGLRMVRGAPAAGVGPRRPNRHARPVPDRHLAGSLCPLRLCPSSAAEILALRRLRRRVQVVGRWLPGHLRRGDPRLVPRPTPGFSKPAGGPPPRRFPGSRW